MLRNQFKDVIRWCPPQYCLVSASLTENTAGNSTHRCCVPEMSTMLYKTYKKIKHFRQRIKIED